MHTPTKLLFVKPVCVQNILCKSKSVFLRWYKPLACFLFALGLLLALCCYLALLLAGFPEAFMAPPVLNPAPQKKDFKVSVFSDWCLRTTPLDKVAADTLQHKADFVLLLGDFAKAEQPSVIRFATELLKKNFTVPIYVTPGNHDIHNSRHKIFYQNIFGHLNNFFSYGDTLFISLETAKEYLTGEQLDFLQAVLKHERPRYRRCVVMTHVPPVLSPQYKYKKSLKCNVGQLQKIMDSGNVDLMICGHAHCEMELDFGKTKLLVLPASGQTPRNSQNPEFGCLRLHFKEDGTISRKFIYCGTESKKAKFRYFIHKRLNRRGGGFFIACGLMLCSILIFLVGSKLHSHPTAKGD